MAQIPSSGLGGFGGSGWVKVVDITAPGGVVLGKVFQDPPHNTILDLCTVTDLDLEVEVRSAFPLVEINGVATVLEPSPDGGHYFGLVPVSVTGTGMVEVKSTTPDGNLGASDAVVVLYEAPPQILSLELDGAYPGIQTELRAGQTFELIGTVDKPTDAIEILDFGAGAQSLEVFVSGLTFVVTGTIADRGDASQLLSVKARARDAVTGGFGEAFDTALGGSVEWVHVVRVCNLHPTVILGTPDYPVDQLALKGSEIAQVPFFYANLDAVVFDSPTEELAITNPVIPEATKTVSRIAGLYNVTTPNLRATATRAANGAMTVTEIVVAITAIPCTLEVSLPAVRLKSGGSDGTAPQDHQITLTASQALLEPPSLEPDPGGDRGTFLGSWTGGPEIWTRVLRVSDDDEKGTYFWSGVSAKNLAGIETTSITTGASYILGGFVGRTATWQPFATVSDPLNVQVSDPSSLQAGLWSATNQPGVFWPLGTPPPKQDGYTVQSVGYPLRLVWLDSDAANSNSGEAYLFDLEEVP